MKRMIRKWLGVPDVSDYATKSDLHLRDYDRMAEMVRCEVAAALEEAFKPEIYRTGRYWSENTYRSLTGKLERYTKEEVGEQARRVAQDHLDAVLNKEELLEQIVDRVVRKQILPIGVSKL